MRGSGDADSDGSGPVRSAPIGSVLVHDLTNHLQIIEGNADLLLDRLDDPSAVDRLTAIKRQSVAASSLIRTVREMADAEPDERLDTVDAGRVIETETRHLRSAYPNADVSTDVPDGIAIRADDLLDSVFRNLLQNAVQHNDSRTPRVSVAVRSKDSNPVVVIEDDGPGLPDDVRDELLGVVRPTPGSGIGIVRALVDRYDATISVEGGEKGTTVSIEFPRGEG